MKKSDFPFLFSLLIIFFFNLGDQFLFGQLIYKKSLQIDYVELITPQYKPFHSIDKFKLTKEMAAAINFAQRIVNPLIKNQATEIFLNKYYPAYSEFLLRNGDIAYLKFYYTKYLVALKKCQQIADKQDVRFNSSRKEFFKKSTLQSKKAKRIYWRTFHKSRGELIARFLKFRHYILPAVSTEIAMILQKEHFFELSNSMNTLKNFDGTPLETLVYSNYKLAIPEFKKRHIAGLSIISKCENVFTSGSPAVRQTYPGLRGSNKGLTVHLRMFENGITLSHELGHLYYLAQKWEEYIDYIRKKGKDYEPGGHGKDDPSGYAASLTEKGIMPF